jgi:hypothetical protein
MRFANRAIAFFSDSKHSQTISSHPEIIARSLDHWIITRSPKNQTNFTFIFPKGRRIVKKTKTHHVSQMPQAMQNMKTQMLLLLKT